MSEKLNLPSEEIMRGMAKMAMEQATTFFAKMADDFAPHCSKLNGQDAILAFAEAIRSTNKKLYGGEVPFQ